MLGRGLDDHGAELGHGADEFGGEGGDGFDLFVLLMQGGGLFELHFGGGLVAGAFDVGEHGFAMGGEEGLDREGFGAVLVGVAGHVAGGHAFFHLAVGAAGVIGMDLKVFVAAAEFEEVEDGVAVALGGRRGRGRGRRSGLILVC